MCQNIKFKILPYPKYIIFLKKYVDSINILQENKIQIKFCLDEILSNIIEHSYNLELINLEFIIKPTLTLIIKKKDKSPVIINIKNKNELKARFKGVGLFLIKENCLSFDYKFIENISIFKLTFKN